VFVPIVTMIAVGLILLSLDSMFLDYPSIRLSTSETLFTDTATVPYYNDGYACEFSVN
jgi:hypothetical protein